MGACIRGYACLGVRCRMARTHMYVEVRGCVLVCIVAGVDTQPSWICAADAYVVRV